MSEELKSCPFCGCGAVIDSYNNTYSATCPNCLVEVDRFDNKEDCIKAWNNRPIEDEKDREIESLKSTLNSIIEMAKTYGVLYCKEDNGWELSFGNDDND